MPALHELEHDSREDADRETTRGTLPRQGLPKPVAEPEHEGVTSKAMFGRTLGDGHKAEAGRERMRLVRGEEHANEPWLCVDNDAIFEIHGDVE